jgi:quercetin dioxygenase-like cupin family protein
MSITQLARAADLSPSFVSQAERDMSMPSVRTLNRLADCLGLDVNALLGEAEPVDASHNGQPQGGLATYVVRGDQRTSLDYHGSATRYELLAPELKSDVEFLWVKAPPGTTNGPHPFRHGGRECGVVLAGSVEFRAASETFVLGPGDSIYLAAGVEHSWKVLGDEEWQAVWVIL